MRTTEGIVAAPKKKHRKSKSRVGISNNDYGDAGPGSPSIFAGHSGNLLAAALAPGAAPQQAWLNRGERAVTKLTEQLDCLVDAF